MKSTESTCRNPECGKLYFKFKTTDKYCSFDCSKKCEKPPNLKLAPISKPITPKCKVCREKFTPKRQSTEPTCDNYDCKVKYATEYAKKLGLQNAKDLRAKKFKEKRETIEKLKTLSQLESEAKKSFQKWVRLRDKGKPCISCGTPKENDRAGGHFYSAGMYSGLMFNPDNCHSQCNTHCNRYLSGNLLEYRKGLLSRYGIEFVENLDSIADAKRDYKYTRQELIEIKNKYDIMIKQNIFI